MDIVLYNANIYTVDENFSRVDGLAVKDGKIAATWKGSGIPEKFAYFRAIDLHGKFVYPGFIDPHSHFYDYGKGLINADLTTTGSIDEVIEIVIDHKKRSGSGWVVGHGWDQNKWENQDYPDRWVLDRVFPDIPVVLLRICTHAAVANTEALHRSGVNTEEPGKYGKMYLKKNGELTGLVTGVAKNRLLDNIPEPESEDKLRGMKKAEGNCFAAGLTTVSDAGVDRKVIEFLDSQQKNGELKIRLYSMLKPTRENFEAFLYNGIYRTDHINVCSVKLFADGALGSRGALLIEPYCDDPQNNGMLAESIENLKKYSVKAFKYGFQVNTHCIGDLAIRLVLNLYGEILKESNDKRWRIEHAQIVHPDDVELFGKYSVIPSVQAIHATSDMTWAEKRIGPHRLKNSYIYKDLLKQNGWLANGSDFPVEPVNPMPGFYSAVARKNSQGSPPGGFQTENALSREEALRSMTLWAAKANFEDNVKGSLEPGKMADFVVTNEDIMSVPIDKVMDIKILETFLGGESVYRNKELLNTCQKNSS